MSSQIIKKFSEHLGESPIYSFRGPFAPLFCGCSWSSSEIDPLLVLFISKGRDAFWAINEKVYFGFAQKSFKDYLDKKTNLTNLREVYNSLITKIDVHHEQIMKAEMSDLDDKTLAKLVEQSGAMLSELIDKTIYIETFDLRIAVSVLNNDRKAFIENFWEKATHPIFMSFEGRRLADTISTIKAFSNKDDVVKELKYIYTDYFSSKNDTEILSAIDEIKSNLEANSAKLEGIKRELAIHTKEFTVWLDTLSPEQRSIVDYIQFIMELRDLRKDPIARLQVTCQEIAHEMFRRAELPVEMAYSMMPPELGKGIEYLKENKTEILKRAKGFVGLIGKYGDYQIEVADFDLLMSDFDNVIGKKRLTDTASVSGQTACKGKVRGVVRIVLDPHDDKGFKQGDILVTSMTRPEFVPIMKKAGAVVTNEGGVTCHAAIVSRELGIPCIIGTKVATRVFKDGDMVEVDADKGVVTILNI